MKKTILFLALIASSAIINNLNGFCIYNYSNTHIFAYAYKPGTPVEFSQFKETIDPGKSKCWNWANTGAGSRETEWQFILSKTTNFSSGKFPVGGAVVLWDLPSESNPNVTVHFGPDPNAMPGWEYWKSPWNHSSKPWTP